MPSEVRRIIFRSAEVVRAITSYHRRMQQSLPSGTIVRCGAQSDGAAGTVRFSMMLMPDRLDPAKRDMPGHAEPRETIVEGPALAAALMLYCRDHHIPLPAKARKSLQLVGEEICLLVTIKSGASQGLLS